jgi:hypothetical protein
MTCDIPYHMSFLFPILNSGRLNLHKWTLHPLSSGHILKTNLTFVDIDIRTMCTEVPVCWFYEVLEDEMDSNIKTKEI